MSRYPEGEGKEGGGREGEGRNREREEGGRKRGGGKRERKRREDGERLKKKINENSPLYVQQMGRERGNGRSLLTRWYACSLPICSS